MDPDRTDVHTFNPYGWYPRMAAGIACDVDLLKCKLDEKLLISRVSGTDKRENMEILISTDGGETFKGRYALSEGDARPGYSDMTRLRDQSRIALIHCRDNRVLISGISRELLGA